MKEKLTPEELIAIIENEKRRKEEQYQVPLQDQVHIPEDDPNYEKKEDKKGQERGIQEYRF